MKLRVPFQKDDNNNNDNNNDKDKDKDDDDDADADDDDDNNNNTTTTTTTNRRRTTTTTTAAATTTTAAAITTTARTTKTAKTTRTGFSVFPSQINRVSQVFLDVPSASPFHSWLSRPLHALDVANVSQEPIHDLPRTEEDFTRNKMSLSENRAAQITVIYSHLP